MSLINDALRKARLEAARQDAGRRGIPLPAAKLGQPGRSTNTALLSAAALVMLLLVGASLYFAGRRSAQTPLSSTPTPAAPSDAVAQPPASGGEPGAPLEKVVQPFAAAAPARPAPVEPLRVEPAARANGSGSRGKSGGHAEGLPATRPRADRTLVEEVSSPVEAPAVFVSRADLAGNVQLELGGIAWSEHRPFVLINGEVLGAGDRVRGFTIVSIEPRQVELQSPSESLILKLK